MPASAQLPVEVPEVRRFRVCFALPQRDVFVGGEGTELFFGFDDHEKTLHHPQENARTFCIPRAFFSAGVCGRLLPLRACAGGCCPCGRVETKKGAVSRPLLLSQSVGTGEPSSVRYTVKATIRCPRPGRALRSFRSTSQL